MLSMENIQELKPDWTNRRKVIKGMLMLLAILLALTPFGVAALAYFGKFALYESMFFIIFNSFTFLSILGIIGSYVFGARWENKDFLLAITNIVPDFPKKNEAANIVEDIIDGDELSPKS